MVVGDGSMIPGWEKALKTMRVGESAVVQVLDPTTWGYGASGVPGIVPPNSPLVLEIEVLDRQSPTENIDFDSLATADSTPRTASDIAAAFERRQAKKAAEEGPAKEGLEAWIEKARNFYFFGLFEGETGERPPWFLRPSITFPLAFLVVGAAFYITFAGGAIYERGAQVKDELDEFIVSSSNNDNHLLLPASVVLALLSSGGTF
jgi:FK506-binding protein 1